MNKNARVFSSVRLSLLAAALVLSSLALGPASPARASGICGASWTYFGCCYAGGRVTEKQQQTCCDNGSCYNNYRCTSLACPV